MRNNVRASQRRDGSRSKGLGLIKMMNIKVI
jgi:hypothetical protein